MKFELVVRYVPKASFFDRATKTEIQCSWVSHKWEEKKDSVMSVSFFFENECLETGLKAVERLKHKVMTKFTSTRLADFYVRIDGVEIEEFIVEMSSRLQQSFKRAIEVLRPCRSRRRYSKAIRVQRDLKTVLLEIECAESTVESAVQLEKVAREEFKILQTRRSKRERGRVCIERAKQELRAI